ncbi:MAG: DUF1801 domain-containing protein [Phycisphaera sp.]|nr:DUF1801 domain-containing protein [Phycisphaera sp.]
MNSNHSEIETYVGSLSADRQEAIKAIQAVVRKSLSAGYAEGMQYGMPAWFVPHEIYPAGYHASPDQPLPFVSVASQKKHIGIYLFCLYLDQELMAWFESEWRKTGKRWDAGKSCIRVRSLEEVPLDLLGELITRMPAPKFIEQYEANRSTGTSKKKASRKTVACRSIRKKTSRRHTRPSKE